MTSTPIALEGAAEHLKDALGELVLLPGDAGFEAACMPWNIAVRQTPFALARPTSAEDVVTVVRAAVAAGLRVAPQSTGHAAGALAGTDLSRTVLVSLALLRGVTVDASARTARVLGGSVWNDVLDAVAPLGLTAPHGSAGDVSVVGYCLSGGISFYGRAHGLGVGFVREVTLVTADGRLLRVGHTEHADLFWALRGGSGSFGIVVSVEIDLLPYADVYAGMLLWDASRAAAVTHAWREWTAAVPESVTTTLRIMHFPPLGDLPPFLSGRSVVVIDGAALGDDASASEILAPLRALDPEVDTFARMHASGLVDVHMDPPAPSPALTDHAMLSGLPAAAVDAFVDAAMSVRPTMSELRHTGGALARRAEDAGAIGSLDGEYLLHAVGIVPAPELADLVGSSVREFTARMAPWWAPERALTFADTGDLDRASAFGSSWPRLVALKKLWDPENVFAAAHPVG